MAVIKFHKTNAITFDARGFLLSFFLSLLKVHSLKALLFQLLSVIVLHWEYRKGIHSSGLMFFFWLFLVIFSVIPLRSYISQLRSQVCKLAMANIILAVVNGCSEMISPVLLNGVLFISDCI